MWSRIKQEVSGFVADNWEAGGELLRGPKLSDADIRNIADAEIPNYRGGGLETFPGYHRLNGMLLEVNLELYAHTPEGRRSREQRLEDRMQRFIDVHRQARIPTCCVCEVVDRGGHGSQAHSGQCLAETSGDVLQEHDTACWEACAPNRLYRDPAARRLDALTGKRQTVAPPAKAVKQSCLVR